jgi:hypothetical protein
MRYEVVRVVSAKAEGTIPRLPLRPAPSITARATLRSFREDLIEFI